MSVPVFTYFCCKALGDGPRMLMAYGDYKFEDRRIRLADWPDFKTKTPFGQLPVLELNAKEYTQSTALARYFGRKFGLAGANDEEALEIDAIVDFLNDIRIKATIVYDDTDEKVKAEKHADLAKNVYPDLLKKLASVAEKNNGHLALGKLTWADFVFAGVFDYLTTLLQMPDLAEQFPVFKKVLESVLTIPKVKKYLSNAPEAEEELPF